MAKSWYLPEEVSLTIRYQPIATSVLTGKKKLPSSVARLLAIVSMAKNISNEYRHYWNTEQCENSDEILGTALGYLDVCGTEFSDLKEDHVEDLMEEEVA